MRTLTVTRGRRQLLFLGLVAGLMLALLSASEHVQAAETTVKQYPAKTWTYAANPEDCGWSAEKLAVAREYSREIGSSAVMIIVNGVVLTEWGDITRPMNCHSMRKSFISALYGIYAGEGCINLTASLEELGIDDRQGLTPGEKQARVRDLLKARSGVYHPAAYETTAMKQRRPARGSHSPGAFWYYNNWDFNALGTIFERQTGIDVLAAFQQRIAQPLEMEDFGPDNTEYRYEDCSLHPAYLFRMSARDMARFGLLFLRQGEWAGRQIVPREWVDESTASHSLAGPGVGYGYMWWTAVDGKHFGLPVNGHAYSARGHGGQYIIVIPAYDMIVVHTADWRVTRKPVSNGQLRQLLRMILNARLH